MPSPGRDADLNHSALYSLDIQVISELRRLKPHGAVLAWLQSVPDNDLSISAVSLSEIQAGIELTRDQAALGQERLLHGA